MGRAVYIGGFGNGATSADGVATALTQYYNDVDVFTFSSAMDRPDVVRRAVRGVDVVTHSAGMLAVVGSLPKSIEAFGAPLPRSKLGLVGRTVAKTVRMHTPGVGIQSAEDIPAIASYDLSTTAELAAHPKGNLGRLGQIARFNAVDTAIAAERSGIPTALTYTNGDEYFHLTTNAAAAATAVGVYVSRIPGIHDELIIRPSATLQQAAIGQKL